MVISSPSTTLRAGSIEKSIHSLRDVSTLVDMTAGTNIYYYNIPTFINNFI